MFSEALGRWGLPREDASWRGLGEQAEEGRGQRRLRKMRWARPDHGASLARPECAALQAKAASVPTRCHWHAENGWSGFEVLTSKDQPFRLTMTKAWGVINCHVYCTWKRKEGIWGVKLTQCWPGESNLPWFINMMKMVVLSIKRTSYFNYLS